MMDRTKIPAILAMLALCLSLPVTAAANVSQCLACHSVEAGASHRAGPNLHDICGKPIGAMTDFVYSKAMKDHGGIWNHAEIIALIADTRKAFPGTRMAMAPVRDEARQQQLVADLEEKIGCRFAR